MTRDSAHLVTILDWYEGVAVPGAACWIVRRGHSVVRVQQYLVVGTHVREGGWEMLFQYV